MLRMVATDLDRTLLDRAGRMEDETVAALEACRAKGLTLVYATARPARATWHLPVIPDYVLANNGATLMRGRTVLRTQNIPREMAQAALGAFMACPAVACVGVEDGERVLTTWQGPDWGEGWNATYTAFEKGIDADTPKLTVQCASAEAIAACMAAFPALKCFANRGEDWAQIQLRDVSKGAALAWLAKSLGIELSEILAFGDDENDLEMIKICGRGVAVANASEAVRAAADEVCDPHDSQGVARWLRSHILCLDGEA